MFADQPTPTAGESATDNSAPTLLTDATRQIDLVHTTLVGMAGIVLLLYTAALLPVLGKQPVTDVTAAVIMGVAAIAGIVVLAMMNFRVHQHVTDHARLMEVLVNSLGQGFLSFDHTAQCGPIYSQACLDMLEANPAKREIVDVLRVPAEAKDDFIGWVQVLFDPSHALGFDDAVRFLPQDFPHSMGRNIGLAYKAIRNKSGSLINVVVIVTDRTEETEAQKRALERQHFASMICKIFKERNQFITTIGHIREFIAFMGQERLALSDMPHIMRQLHTLKAAVRHFDLMNLGTIIHEVESEIRKANITDAEALAALVDTAHKTISDEFGRVLLQVRDLIGTEDEKRGTVYEITEDRIYDFAAYLKKRPEALNALQEYYDAIASVPIQSCFLGFERELIELAQEMDKDIKPVQFSGGDTKVLVRPMQDFFFALTHVSRNIIDHGIEPPVTRMARGKDASGLISVSITVENKEWLCIRIADDGAGIDPSRIRQKLATTDPDGSWRFENDQAVIQRIFGWGVSTRDGVSELSGRGVGLEAVSREVEKLGGTVKVQSEIYRGTQFIIRLPYRLAL